MWDEQETDVLSDDYAFTTTTAEAEATPSDDCTQNATEVDRKALHLCIWLVNYLTHLQSVFHLSDDALQSILKFFSFLYCSIKNISYIFHYCN